MESTTPAETQKGQPPTKILIVEDEASMLASLVEKFHKEGFEVIAARNGRQGLLEFRNRRPDVVLLDILMAEMDGLTMLKQLRADSTFGAKVPVILLTNLSPDNDHINSIITETEPSYYLVKTNWKMDEVVEKVRTVLARPYAA